MSMKVKRQKADDGMPTHLKSSKKTLALALSVPNEVPWTEEQRRVGELLQSNSATVHKISEGVVTRAVNDQAKNLGDDSIALEAWLEATTLTQTTVTNFPEHLCPPVRMGNVSTDGGKTWKLREINKPIAAWLKKGDHWGHSDRTDEEYPTRAEYRKRSGLSSYHRRKVRLVSNNDPFYKGPSWTRKLSNLYAKDAVEGFEKYHRPPTLSDIYYQYWKDLETYHRLEKQELHVPLRGHRKHEVSVIEWENVRSAECWGPTPIIMHKDTKALLIEVESEQHQVLENLAGIEPYAGDPAISAANDEYYDNGEPILHNAHVEEMIKSLEHVVNDPAFSKELKDDALHNLEGLYATKVGRLEADLSVAVERGRGYVSANGQLQEVFVSTEGKMTFVDLPPRDDTLDFVGPILPNLLVQLQTLQLKKIKENIQEWRRPILEREQVLLLDQKLQRLDVHNYRRDVISAPLEKGYSTEPNHICDVFFKKLQAPNRVSGLRREYAIEMKRIGNKSYTAYTPIRDIRVESYTNSPPVFRKIAIRSSLPDDLRYTLWCKACAATEGKPTDFQERVDKFANSQTRECIRISLNFWEYLLKCKRIREDDFLSVGKRLADRMSPEELLLPSPDKSCVEVIEQSDVRIEPVVGDEVLETPVHTHEFDMDRLDDAIDKAKPINIDELLLDPIFSRKDVQRQMAGSDVFAAKIFGDVIVETNPLKIGMTADQKIKLLSQFGRDHSSGLLIPKGLHIEPSEFKEMLPSDFGRKRSVVEKLVDWMNKE